MSSKQTDKYEQLLMNYHESWDFARFLRKQTYLFMALILSKLFPLTMILYSELP